MILLEVGNHSLREILLQRFQAAKAGHKPDKVKFKIADFDGALFKISNDEKRSIIKVSLSLKFFHELQQYDAEGLLKKIYGDRICSTTDSEYNVTIQYDLTKLPDDIETLATEASMLKRNCFAAVFEKFFEYQSSGEFTKQAIINYRDDETMYVKAMEDRITVIFSTIFKDPDDVIIGKIFIQELTEANRKCRNAPQVIYSHKNPPNELSGTKAIRGDNVSYITFVLFTRHFENMEQRNKTIDLIHTFRNYLHYHIKCTKAHIHMRMRAKSSEFLKVLVRAKPELGVSSSSGGGEPVDFRGQDLGVEGLNLSAGDVDPLSQKKTFSGRTFRPVN